MVVMQGAAVLVLRVTNHMEFKPSKENLMRICLKYNKTEAIAQ